MEMVFRKGLIILGVWILIMLDTANPMQAISFPQLPESKQSDHWQVSIKEAKNDPRIEKPNPRKFDTYELEVQNISGEYEAVMVRIYRNEPKTTVRYGLALMDGEKTAALKNLEGNATHPAISVTKAASRLEVDVLWTEEEGGRPYKETFIFSNE